jgi:acetylornithine/succinyldiaminopimelate/putrescine aminotransferase
MGLLLGMKLNIDGAPLVKQCMQNGFLINCIQERILRFIPPLIISREEIDQLIECLDGILTDAASS